MNQEPNIPFCLHSLFSFSFSSCFGWVLYMFYFFKSCVSVMTHFFLWKLLTSLVTHFGLLQSFSPLKPLPDFKFILRSASMQFSNTIIHFSFLIIHFGWHNMEQETCCLSLHRIFKSPASQIFLEERVYNLTFSSDFQKRSEFEVSNNVWIFQDFKVCNQTSKISVWTQAFFTQIFQDFKVCNQK